MTRCNAAPAPGQHNSPIYSDAQWRWVADKHRAGYRQVELARFLGVSRETVRRHLRRLGAIGGNREDLPELDKTEFYGLDVQAGIGDDNANDT